MIDNTAFNTKIRAAILEKFVDLVPADELDAMISAEIKAFFETEVAPFVKGTIQVPNPRYNPQANYSYDSATLPVPALMSSLRITPFRQLVWDLMHTYVTTAVNTVINDRNTEFGASLARYMSQHAHPAIGTSLDQNMHTLGAAMSSVLLSSAMRTASESAHEALKSALSRVGIKPEDVNSIPYFAAPPSYATEAVLAMQSITPQVPEQKL